MKETKLMHIQKPRRRIHKSDGYRYTIFHIHILMGRNPYSNMYLMYSMYYILYSRLHTI